eukprot:4332921-Karenia_brevis.AAC.1
MATFSWHWQTVADRLHELPGALQDQGQAAYDWLWDNNPRYQEFVQEQADFFERHPNATDKERKRWLRCIERPGVECAVWPHLFWDEALCFTVERATNPGRQARP